MKKLDEHKAFPYVAWVLVIGFAAYVGKIAMYSQLPI
jgi:hypothetical protein